MKCLFAATLAISAILGWSQPPAMAQASDAVAKSCRQQANKVMGKSGSGERGRGARRQAMIDQCMRNGGRLP